MAVQDITTFTYQDIFSLQEVQFEKACIVNESNQVDRYSIFWIKKGKGVYNIDFKQYSFSDNVIFFLSPGQIFAINSEEIQEAYQLSFVKDFYCIETRDSSIACNGVLFNNLYETPFVKPKQSDNDKLDFILNSLKEELAQEEAAQYDMLQAYLKQFIIHSVRIKESIDEVKEDTSTRLFKDFSLLVEKSYTEMHSVGEYATRLGVSPKSLAKHFLKIGVESPSTFIKNRLLLEAKRKLFYTNTSIKEIAYELGFNDPSYFTRFFTKSASKSPQEFRKTQQEV